MLTIKKKKKRNKTKRTQTHKEMATPTNTTTATTKVSLCECMISHHLAAAVVAAEICQGGVSEVTFQLSIAMAMRAHLD
jgi:hypothetical protein